MDKPKSIASLVNELPKSTWPASVGQTQGTYPFFLSGPTPKLCDEYLHEGAAIVLSTGGNAAIHFGEGRFGYSTDCWVLEPRPEEAFPKYLYYWLVNKQEQIDVFGFEGSGLRHLRKDYVRGLTLEPPQIPEQEKIAEVLTKLDHAVEQTEALIAKQQCIKTGLMQDLLTKGIDEHGNIRSEATHAFKDSPLGRIPVEWDCQTAGALLSDGILSEIQDGNHGELHPKSSDFVPEGVPFVMASDIAGGVIDLVRAKRITEAQYRSLRIGFAKPRDVLLSHKASIGFVAVVPDDVLQLMLTPQVTYYRIGDSERMNYKYLAQFFRSEKFQEPLKSLAKQSTRDYIGILAQQDLQIAYPLSITEQVRIAHMLTGPDQVIDTHSTLLNKLRALKTGLMHDLLTGERRVTSLLAQAATP